jgi:hypothetical protein
MNAQTVALLQGIVRRESLSMLTYVGEAFPWTTLRDADSLAKLKQIVTANNEAVAMLGRFLTKHRQPLTFLGSYPGSFTTINFISLDHILPKLLESERANVAALDRDLHGLSDKDARPEVEKLLAVKKAQLEKLEFLAGSHAKTPAAAAS